MLLALRYYERPLPVEESNDGRRRERVRRLSRVRDSWSLGDEPFFLAEDPGFEPVLGEFVHAARRREFRGYQARAVLYSGQSFETVAPVVAPQPAPTRPLSPYFNFEMFNRLGIRPGRRHR